MIRSLRKTSGRTGRFLGDSLAWRASDRQYALVAWGLMAGAVWLAAGLAAEPGWSALALAGLYLGAILAAVCAIDARYGIIPNSFVIALAVGGILLTLLVGEGELLQRGFEAALVFASASLFRAAYRWMRGQDGLGFGDVKFTTAAVLWVGIEGVPGLLLVAVSSALASLVIVKSEGYHLHGKQAISFGPHLAIGLWVTWIVGPLQLSF
jgi:leader peptidase (prepilin peptidase) / N-methyltransferase